MSSLSNYQPSRKSSTGHLVDLSLERTCSAVSTELSKQPAKCFAIVQLAVKFTGGRNTISCPQFSELKEALPCLYFYLEMRVNTRRVTIQIGY